MAEELERYGSTWRDDLSRAEHATHVLAGARQVLHRGWSQGSWHVVQGAPGRRRDIVSPGVGLDRTQVVSRCLVGAVLQAAWWYSDRPEHSAPALDALWLELQEQLGNGVPEPIERVCSPDVRTARVRDLTRWNDRPGRTVHDVLALVDRSLERLSTAAV